MREQLHEPKHGADADVLLRSSGTPRTREELLRIDQLDFDEVCADLSRSLAIYRMVAGTRHEMTLILATGQPRLLDHAYVADLEDLLALHEIALRRDEEAAWAMDDELLHAVIEDDEEPAEEDARYDTPEMQAFFERQLEAENAVESIEEDLDAALPILETMLADADEGEREELAVLVDAVRAASEPARERRAAELEEWAEDAEDVIIDESVN